MSLDALEVALNQYEAALSRGPGEHSPGHIFNTASSARTMERGLTDQQIEDPLYPPLLARLRHLEHLRKTRGNPAELLRNRIREAAALLADHPGALADQLLAILKPDEP